MSSPLFVCRLATSFAETSTNFFPSVLPRNNLHHFGSFSTLLGAFQGILGYRVIIQQLWASQLGVTEGLRAGIPFSLTRHCPKGLSTLNIACFGPIAKWAPISDFWAQTHQSLLPSIQHPPNVRRAPDYVECCCLMSGWCGV